MAVAFSSANAGKPDVGKPQWSSHTWVEPIIIVTIMVTSMVMNRRKGFRIIANRKRSRSLLDGHYEPYSADDVPYARSRENDPEDQCSTSRRPSKNRNCCGFIVHTPNSSRFANHIHSRILQKFPFLVEMFYWALNLVFYVLTKAIAQRVFSYDGMWEMAQTHGLNILSIEHGHHKASALFPIREIDVQQWFMHGHGTGLTFLNRAYSLVHIPGTVSFISWYYYVAPTHSTFAVFRRTMTLTNLVAFIGFTLYPCMPPRLLPAKYGFHDTVRHDNAESVWAGGNFVNQLAAMPSLHFGYAFCIGCTLLFHSRQKKARIWQLLNVVAAVVYPSLVLTVIIATANHYWLDALAATVVVLVAFLCNRVFMLLLPAEDLLLWVLRLEKPVPTTGDRGSGYLLVQESESSFVDSAPSVA